MVTVLEAILTSRQPREEIQCLYAYGQFFARGGGKPFAQKIIASYPNFYETVVYEKKRGPYFATT